MITPLIRPNAIQRRLPFRLRSQPGPGSAFLVGICGSGMKALAELLTGLGWQVTGSDLRPPSSLIQGMQERGLRVHRGHDGRFLSPDTDVLVYSPAVAAENPERRLATRLGIPQLSYSQMLGKMMRARTGVSVAGTHGKSTTTAMLATILEDAQLSPSAVIGADLCDTGLSGWAGDGEHFVVESCEYQRNFLELTPTYTAILGIESDHFDCFHDLSDVKSAFSQFVGNLPAEGLVVAASDCAATMDVVRAAPADVVTFAQQSNADWWATDMRQSPWGTRFRIFHHGEYFTEVLLRVPGAHNMRNALAAAAVSHHLGVSAEIIRESLGEFQGIRRRFERVGSWRGVTLIDDYAHHPTAVRATLRTARQQFPNRRIWCVYQPHQASRTERLMDEFATCFDEADRVVMVPIFAAREESAPSSDALVQELVRRIGERGQCVRYLASLDQLTATLEDDALPGDVAITMGAGDIDRIHHEFTRRLRPHPQAR